MFRGLTITGKEAEIRWGYRKAARLSSYILTADGASGTVTGTVAEADSFTLTQPALTFRIVRQNGPAWSYPVQSLQVADGTLTARVSLQE